MINQELVIQLDLKNNQLNTRLSKAGLEVEERCLGITDIVAELMHVPQKEDLRSKWFETYLEFMDDAEHFELSGKKESLKPLAAMCFSKLQELLNADTRI